MMEGMTKIVDAIFSNGVLKPTEALGLPEQQRVRLIVQVVNGDAPADRQAALERLRSGIAGMSFEGTGPLPSRAEVHGHL